jgi:hypothetical protein
MRCHGKLLPYAMLCSLSRRAHRRRASSERRTHNLLTPRAQPADQEMLSSHLAAGARLRAVPWRRVGTFLEASEPTHTRLLRLQLLLPPPPPLRLISPLQCRYMNVVTCRNVVTGTRAHDAHARDGRGSHGDSNASPASARRSLPARLFVSLPEGERPHHSAQGGAPHSMAYHGTA